MKKIKATDLSRYRKFINARDKALERLHISAQGRITQALANALSRIYDAVAARHLALPHDSALTIYGSQQTQAIAHLIDFEFGKAADQIVSDVKRLRRNAFVLSYLGETEGVARAEGKPMQYNLHKAQLAALEDPPGVPTKAKVILSLTRLKNKLLDAIQIGLIHGDSTKELLARLRSTFPKLKRLKKPKRLLTPLKEAAGPKRDGAMSFGFVDPSEWQDMLDDYLKPYHPEIRDPNLYFDIEGSQYEPLGLDEGEWFGWEVEQQLTSDFVDTVRNGQVQAAKDQGIDDFVWITVFGKTTCDSCEWRNGLTSSEIEAKLEDEDDDYDAIVPPAHASCRCQLAPMVEELGEAPEDLGDFNTWLS